MEADRQSPEEIVHRALEISDPAQRTAYLEQVCTGDGPLRERVEVLLRARQEADGPGGAAGLGGHPTVAGPGPMEGPGTIIGRYKLLERIGEGGMATVYMAEQGSPVHRKVALKILKLGMDTKEVIARFEVERQALALMDHPNIAQVFDGGVTEAGRPFFVMELVRGIPITEYCDRNKLDTRERLGLFVPVCNAVQHAHQKGIIHRDIKPSNVLVTLHDGLPIPKVIDFGIAKATNQRLTEKTLFTRFAQLIGTPEYMSPEQAEMSGLDVDTRTDIYSLGVLLYELLTGTTPFEGERLRRAGYAEVQRIIRETEPLKPSTRLSTLGQTLTGVAQSRHASPELLRRLVRGDLDWIVMKTLEKDRTRRYETAHALAEDVERHLRDEPVSAGRPSALGRCRKFVRRHRAPVTGVAAVMLVLAIGIVVSTVFAVGQARARAEAERQVQISRAVAEFIRSLIGNTVRTYTGGDPTDEAMQGAVEHAMETLEQKLDVFAPEPLMDASIRTLLAIWRVGPQRDYDASARQLSRVLEICRQQLGEEHPDTLLCMTFLAAAYTRTNRYDEAEQLGTRALKTFYGPRFGSTHPDTVFCVKTLAGLYTRQHRYEKAAALLEKLVNDRRHAFGETDKRTLDAMRQLAKSYLAQNQYDKASGLLEKIVSTRGEGHADTVEALTLLVALYEAWGKPEEAQRWRAKLPRHEITVQKVHSIPQENLTIPEDFQPCAANLQKIYTAICAFRRDKGEWPWSLSDLVPTYLAAETLFCPADSDHASRFAPDPKLPCSYSWELSAKAVPSAWGLGRETSFRDLKTQEIGYFGDIVPIARCDHHGSARVLSLSVGGQLYWGPRDWAPMFKPDYRFGQFGDRSAAKALNDLAWVKATHPSPQLRNGREAVEYATRACEMTEWKELICIDTLAAAYAEVGDFESAVKWQEKAISLIAELDRPKEKAQFEERLKLYQSSQPYRENP